VTLDDATTPTDTEGQVTVVVTKVKYTAAKQVALLLLLLLFTSMMLAVCGSVGANCQPYFGLDVKPSNDLMI
jgi:hypothetical protein